MPDSVLSRVNVVLFEPQNQINIAGLELARIEGKALSLFHVDQSVPDAVLAKLRTLSQVVSAELLRL